ncbi:MAG: FeoB-associated Cys-rich membrane protein [Lachnospiraceae bacterium]|nr:FeoB-associated Cys-rich membrane protein [Lachnospiraceae bacterium]
MSFSMADIITAIILLAAVSGACIYIYREKKKGKRCIGCPMAGNCRKSSSD